MQMTPRAFVLIAANVLSASACNESSQAPSGRVEPPREVEGPEGFLLKPVDLIYVCGNRFLATNSTLRPIRVTYQVSGSSETDSLTLPAGDRDDPGHTETELQTVERGAVELYRGEERVAYRRNRGLPCGPSASSASIASADASGMGEWTAPFPWPMTGVHLNLLPDGNVLTWGDGGDAQIWRPATGNFTPVPKPVEIFCAGHTFLADGRLLIAGGKYLDTSGWGIPDVVIFDPATSSFSRSTLMQRGRWYPSVTTLPSGDALLLSGTDETGEVVDVPEVWSNGGIRVLSGASKRLPNYPRVFVAPNGQVYYAGQQQKTRYLDPNGTGLWTDAGERLYGLRDYGAAVMYEPGKILYAGGGRTTNTAEIVDLNRSGQWEWTGSMAFPRRHLNATLVPTGEVLVIGGSSGTNFNDKDLPVHQAEIWNPTTGAWTILASNTANRTYHSTAILMPDGRILSAGANEVGMRTAELFSPPYLFRGPRPTITGAPRLVAYGASFRVTTPEASDIAKVSLIRLGSTTHAFDSSERFTWLSFRRETGALTITAPPNPNVAPPGHYLLFVLNSNEVPSVARIVKLGTVSDPGPPPNAAPRADFSQLCEGLTCSFTDGSTDGDGTVKSWSWNFGDGSTAEGADQTHTYASESSYEVTLTVTDDDDATGTATHTVIVPPPPPSPNTAPVAAFTSTCDGLACSFTDGSTDSDGTIVAWRWTFGNGTSSVNRNPSRTYGAPGTYTVTLQVTDDDAAVNQISVPVTVTATNTAPNVSFSQMCTGLSCRFTDLSTDSDGTMAGWRWTFGNGTSSTNANPSRTYASAGTYTVTLRVTDNAGASSQDFIAVKVITSTRIVLSLTAAVTATTQSVTLNWSGARGTTVDVYRNGNLLRQEANDGRYINARTLPGVSKVRFQICEVGTTVCSNEASLVF
jgi:PKD repeat protein